jgi:EAL domain-containing protein (putative c-di-GMP-specific phosphodiesterase class I)
MQPDLFEQIDRVLEETGLDTQSLILEVSDRAIMEINGAASDAVVQLKARGVQIHLDYFEASESSLKIMRDLRVDTVKIEPAHIHQLNNGQAISNNIQKAVQQARQSGVDLVAVGIETEEQLERIKALEFTYGQGYFFSEPLDVEAVEDLIASTPGVKIPSKNPELQNIQST